MSTHPSDPDQPLCEEILSLLKAELPAFHDVTVDEDLFAPGKGRLDSLQSLHMVFLLENRFQIRFMPHELTKANFRSVKELGRLVRSKRASQ